MRTSCAGSCASVGARTEDLSERGGEGLVDFLLTSSGQACSGEIQLTDLLEMCGGRQADGVSPGLVGQAEESTSADHTPPLAACVGEVDWRKGDVEKVLRSKQLDRSDCRNSFTDVMCLFGGRRPVFLAPVEGADVLGAMYMAVVHVQGVGLTVAC